MSFCTNCGSELKDGQQSCPNCENNMEKKNSNGAIEEMGLLKDDIVKDDLFSKMEGAVERHEVQPASAQENNEISEQEKLRKELEQKEFEKNLLAKHNALSDNYVLGFIGAIVGGLVGAIPWGLVVSRGWFAAYLGYIIAIAAAKGYDLMKVKSGMIKILFVAISVLVGVLAGQIVGDMISIALDPELDGMFSLALTYFSENFGEYLSINATNLVLGLVFAALGGFSVLKNIKTETALIKELKEKYPEV